MIPPKNQIFFGIKEIACLPFGATIVPHESRGTSAACCGELLLCVGGGVICALHKLNPLTPCVYSDYAQRAER